MVDRYRNLLYKDKPVFGLDIGRSTIKAIQIDTDSGHNQAQVIGYGNIASDSKSIKNGLIVDPESVTKAVYELITNNMVGTISTRRVVLSLPNEHCFSRIISLPKMSSKDMETAIISEAGGSIPIPLDQLYIDYKTTKILKDGSVEILLVAAPKDIVDSYLVVTDALGLEVAAIETNITAVTRIVAHSESVEDVVTLIIDLGSTAADLSIFDGKTARITGSADCGSDRITDLIMDKLEVSNRQAYTIKNRFGLEVSKKQKEITEAINSELLKLINEVKKVQRYYSEHSPEGEIGQIIILGGGATLP
ncbi:MAG: pilus assembly protein PilM, partial [Phycisphaeraceae bacterium]|nr:pilus assembly protein PilM [Phycisphaeraceae bacterium]